MRISVKLARRHLIPSDSNSDMTGDGGIGSMIMISQAMAKAGFETSGHCHAPVPFAVPPYRQLQKEARYRYRQMRNERRSEEALRNHVKELEAQWMPNILPNLLYLSETTVQGHDIPPPTAHGFQISANAGGGPLLVGYRYGPRWKNKVEDISLCLGDEWYGSVNGPFFRATSHELTSQFTYRSQAPDASGRYVRKGMATQSALGTIFSFKVPDLADNTPTMQEFEWRHRGTRRLRDSNYSNKGTSILVQKSNNQAVARMAWGHKTGKVLTGDFAIQFLGAGETYGGTWKIVSFMLGILGYHRA